VALILIVLALLGFGFVASGTGTGTTGSAPKLYRPHRVHHVDCKAGWEQGKAAATAAAFP
jgi:hypothetical protein